MVAVSSDGLSSGGLAILDGLRDIRSNVENTVRSFSISGYSAGLPTTILNFPAEVRGYVYSNASGGLYSINYGTEAATAVYRASGKCIVRLSCRFGGRLHGVCRAGEHRSADRRERHCPERDLRSQSAKTFTGSQ